MQSPIKIAVPDLGDFSDVPVIEIPVRVGDVVAAGDTLIVVESDKATLDVPAEIAGRITALHVAMNDKVSAGMALADIEAEGVAADAPQIPATPSDGADRPAPEPAATATTHADMPPAAEPVAAPPSVVPPAPAGDGLPVHASPSIRKLARELGADLSQVTGTGPKGRITREDVQEFVKSALQAPMSAPSSGGLGLDLPEWPRVDHAKYGDIERKPLSRVQRISGPALTRNAIMIPHVTNFDEADVTEIEAFRTASNAEKDATRLSILPFVVRAAVAALQRYPAFNAALDGGDLILRHYWNIGFAADTPDGLVVPVIKGADTKGLRAIAAEMADLSADARAGRLKAADMQGATFTISSLGGIGGTNFTPIINAPDVAILGMTRSAIKPVWDGQAFQPRLIQPLSLSWDHRAVDGVAAARFLGHVRDMLTDFRRISL